MTVLIYHLVCPVKYRRVIFGEGLDESLKEVCLGIEKRYEIRFLEIGIDKDHVHFLVQSIPMYSPKKVVQTIKSISAKEMFKRYPALKQALWGAEFWTRGYFLSTVGKHGDEKQLKNYVRKQGVSESYQVLHQMELEFL